MQVDKTLTVHRSQVRQVVGCLSARELLCIDRAAEDTSQGIEAGQRTAGGGKEIVKRTDLKKEALRRPGVRAEYEALALEFELLRQMLGARTKAGLSQADVATRMGTQAPAIARLESALGNGKHSPSIDTLKRYAEAVGCELQVRFVRRSRPNKRFKPTPTPTPRSGGSAA